MASRVPRIALCILLAIAAGPLAAQVPRADEVRRISATASTAGKAGARSLFAEAFALLQKSEYPAAIALIERGLAIDPANVTGRYHLGLALTGLGNAPAARAQYELIIALAPESEEGAIARGILADIDEDRASQVDTCW